MVEVDQHTGTRFVDTLGKGGKRLHGQRGAHDDQQVGLAQVWDRPDEVFGELREDLRYYKGGELRDTYRFPEEDDVGLYIAPARNTFGDFLLQDMALHIIVVEDLGTVDAALRGEAAMGLDDLFLGNARPALEGIDVLGKASVEEPLLRKQPDKRMRDGRAEFSWVELMG